tara:strand:- start:14 stop:178 length:165 start_codon:yes stop_codon:yes gene_type:complete
MNSKKILKDEVRLAIAVLQEKVASLQRRVDELCESSSECVKTIESTLANKNEKK